MLLYVIRHGETAANVNLQLDTAWPGSPLNETGLAQADALAARMADVPLDAVYASDLTRAVQTATPLATSRNLDVVQLPGLREIQAGSHEMSTAWQPYIDVLEQWRTDPMAHLPGGEDALAFMGRFDAAIAHVAGQHERAAVVAHGAAIRVWFSARVGSHLGEHRLRNTEVLALSGEPGAWTYVESGPWSLES